MRVDRQVDADIPGFLGGRHRLTVGGRPVGLHRLADQPHIQIEAHTGDVAGLFGPEHVAGTANLQVLQRNRHAGAEFVVLGDGRQPVKGGLGERLLARVQEVGVAAFPTAAHAAA